MAAHLVIGAGLAGLTLAKRLKAPVLEKSRGLGGRMATRRINGERFDHGNPCWPESLRCQNLHRGRFIPDGMTALPKRLAEGATIHLETRAHKLTPKGKASWLIETEKGEFQTKHLIITAPLPQALELLQHSGIDTKSAWHIPYHKSIVGLYLFDQINDEIGNCYQEHCLYFQKNRGLAPNGLSFYLSPSRSEDWFELMDQDILERMTQLLWTFTPEKKILHAEVKKWRYALPETAHNYPYLKVAPGLYICGDAFLYPGLEGALASAESLLRSEF